MNIKNNEIKIGMSSCLLGESVRFDAGHKKNRYIVDVLAQFFKFVSFCPEVSIGLGIPRPTIRLIKQDDVIRCVSTKDPTLDYTEQLDQSAQEQKHWHQQLSGYIVKKDSPSCGMERVKVYSNDNPTKEGTGLYTQRLMANFPCLPVEEEGRLLDPVLRENFIKRVFIYHRWQALQSNRRTWTGISKFHAKHKYIFMSHNQNEAKALGNWLANQHDSEIDQLSHQYLSQMMDILKNKATRKTHANTLTHIQGYLKKHIDSIDKQELTETIEQYRLGFLPLIVPITLLKHHFLHHPHQYIIESYYMQPHPSELMLLNGL